MIILFSPSETKTINSTYKFIDEKSFIFPEMFTKRKKVLEIYQNFIKNADLNQKIKLFGIKDKKLLKELKNINIFDDLTEKAILRYSGVGYKYLKYRTLHQDAKHFIDNHLLIFSNLFGVIQAKDKIPFYKLKQGEKIEDFCFEKYYKNEFSNILDNYLKDKLIVDLRASFYEKQYKPKKEYITFKFLKNQKVVSHWAKAYRGIVARKIAINKVKDEEDLMNINFKTLKIIDIKQIKNKKEYLFEIIDK